jgi:sulfide:quinone oxidoreductase
MMTATTTVILGGGFGGLAAAHTLRARLPAEHAVVLVDQSPDFLVGAGKTWVMLGWKDVADIARPRAELLPAGVRYVPAAVERIDARQGEVVTSAGALRADYLVIALGADVNLGAVPGLAEAAHTFYTLAGAQAARPALEAFAGGELIVLIPAKPFKCPPAPYEAALLLHDHFVTRGLREHMRLSVYTCEGAPMATAGPEVGALVRGELAARDIAYYPLKNTARVAGERHAVVFDDGSEAHYDLLLAVPPHAAPRVVREAGLLGPSGWIPVDPQTLRATNVDGPCAVYAVGDVTEVPLPGRFKPDMPLVLPKAGVFAGTHGALAAEHIAAQILGGPAAPAFDGKGFCFLETSRGTALKGDGDFFALPHPTKSPEMPRPSAPRSPRARPIARCTSRSS